MRPLVIVRPEPGASVTARAAEAMGLTAIVIPLFEIKRLDWHAPDAQRFDALLLTSANALRHGGGEIERLKALRAHCVGESTAASARTAGFAVATVGSGGAAELLDALDPGLRLLHLCGADRKTPARARQSIEALPVYEATPLSRDLGVAAGAVVALHSPRAASIFGRDIDAQGLDRGKIAVVAISPETAQAAGGVWREVEAASEPTDAALLAIASRLCNKCP